VSASDHMESIAGLPCLICLHKLGRKQYGVEVHHVGGVGEQSDWATVPLCVEHHRGPTGVHGLHRRAFESMWKVNDLMLLAWTNQQLAKVAA
jgi:hypothetical protein